VPQIRGKWLNEFAPNSQGRRVRSLARTSLNLKVKVLRLRSPGTKNALSAASPPAAYEWYGLAANNVQRQRTAPLRRCPGGGDFGGLRVVYLW